MVLNKNFQLVICLFTFETSVQELFQILGALSVCFHCGEQCCDFRIKDFEFSSFFLWYSSPHLFFLFLQFHLWNPGFSVCFQSFKYNSNSSSRFTLSLRPWVCSSTSLINVSTRSSTFFDSSWKNWKCSSLSNPSRSLLHTSSYIFQAFSIDFMLTTISRIPWRMPKTFLYSPARASRQTPRILALAVSILSCMFRCTLLSLKTWTKRSAIFKISFLPVGTRASDRKPSGWNHIKYFVVMTNS